MAEGTWIEVHYRCANPRCKAEDTDKRLASDASPMPGVVNCWKCGAGRGMDPTDMMAQRKGMFHVPSVELAAVAN